MAKYKVAFTKYAEVIIEANDRDEAMSIATEQEAVGLIEELYYSEWVLDNIKLIKEDDENVDN